MEQFDHDKLLITRLVLGQLDTNCYLLTDKDTQETIIVDPADSAETIIDYLTQQKYQPTAIVLTHGHFDHVLGLLELKLAYDLPVFMHPDDAFLLKEAADSARYWLKRSVDPVPTEHIPLTDQIELTIGKLKLNITPTPGHTPGSVCLAIATKTDQESELVLCTGDTIFKDGLGRTDFSYSKPLALRASLEKLSSFPPSTPCYPGHGDCTTIGQALSILSKNP
ncbi:MBL fold metallo-hydrolase [Candidatus Woesebacteria bacterium]|nr:MBL fold metallo-hydrolase [Candidatus Woesebacteria bacterium]